ncbi:MAG TPA: aldo/keto reductase [Candidatus Ornithocaccomicrobium faecavium]|uniref:Aldo/keto reductase n=1 Tax=Candidatus Ornithocaccomicrobium faecavium TaxID=2840890 RepID=A0A9D1PAN6_9FIRM|nr:aldo/keto reductase [Clostridiales bacterium]HIV29181.1 aldo/keto reductase [Candidatus Ornithocaccomicrobium faecavium]
MEQNAKKLGFGLMRLPLTDPNDGASVDVELLKTMVDAFLEKGFTYFDTAWMYCGFQSECAIREALVKRHPRDSYTLADKLHAGFLKTKEDRERIFQEQLRKTGVDYFDYYLLHDVGTDHYKTYQELDCFRWLEEKKAQGLARHIGFSYHDNAELLDRVLIEHPEVEFVQLQLNYLDWDSEGVQSRKCYETAVKHGKPVIVMEPVKGGTLARVPESVEKMFREARPEMSIPSWAIRFAASLEHVMVVLSGMSNMEQLLDNTDYMADFQPLSAQEQALVKKAVDAINSTIAIPCTGCSYCTEGCPQRIAIPKYFSLYNADLQEIKEKSWRPQGEYYTRLTMNFGKASDCLECGQCEQVCPQHLPIIRHLKDVAARFEK